MADEEIKINEGVWVTHPDQAEPVLISSTALDQHLAQGFVEMTDRARVRDPDQVRMFGPAPDPGAAKPAANTTNTNKTTTGATGAGEG